MTRKWIPKPFCAFPLNETLWGLVCGPRKIWNSSCLWNKETFHLMVHRWVWVRWSYHFFPNGHTFKSERRLYDKYYRTTSINVRVIALDLEHTTNQQSVNRGEGPSIVIFVFRIYFHKSDWDLSNYGSMKAPNHLLQDLKLLYKFCCFVTLPVGPKTPLVSVLLCYVSYGSKVTLWKLTNNNGPLSPEHDLCFKKNWIILY